MSKNKSNAETKAQALLDSIDSSYAMSESDSSFIEVKSFEIGNVHLLQICSLARYQYLQDNLGNTGIECANNYAVKLFWVESHTNADPIGINNASELINAIIELNMIPAYKPPESVQYGLKLLEDKPKKILSAGRNASPIFKERVFKVIQEACKGGSELLLTGKKIVELGNLDFSATSALYAAKQLHDEGLIIARRRCVGGKRSSWFIKLPPC